MPRPLDRGDKDKGRTPVRLLERIRLVSKRAMRGSGRWKYAAAGGAVLLLLLVLFLEVKSRSPFRGWWGHKDDHWEPTTIPGCRVDVQIPKVALLFLTRGDMPHERIWHRWLSSVEDMVPLEALEPHLCIDNGTLPNATHCGEVLRYSGGSAYLNQHLFSVYVHPPPDFKGYPKGNIFRDRIITDRIAVQWGSHSLMDAERRLISSAVADPLNQAFVLLCEASVPLYHPAVIYQQLIHEKTSRINACPDTPERVSLWRYSPKMEIPEVLHEGVWRKSGQFFHLTRKHAEVVNDDFIINAMFSKYCYEGDDWELGRRRDCFSDEHYTPTLLAVHGLDSETTCSGNVVYTDWSAGGVFAHPRTFWRPDISDELLHTMRNWSEHCRYNDGHRCAQCRASEAQKSVQGTFIRTHDVRRLQCPMQPYHHYDASLLSGEQECNLFARKFAAETADLLQELLNKCDVHLDIWNIWYCVTNLEHSVNFVPSNPSDNNAPSRRAARRLTGGV